MRAELWLIIWMVKSVPTIRHSYMTVNLTKKGMLDNNRNSIHTRLSQAGRKKKCVGLFIVKVVSFQKRTSQF